MIRTQDIMASLPLVASVLGDRYDVQVHIGGKQAYTNGRNIHLPTMPLDCNATLLAQARGFLDHEAAHIRHTDFDALQAAKLTPLQKHLWNSIEDWRVENKLAVLFPGCRPHFHWLIQHHFSGEDAITPALSVLNYVVLSVRSWDVPEIAYRKNTEGLTVDTAYPWLRDKLDAILSRVRQQCRNTQDTIAYALELHTVIEAYVQQPVPPEREKSASNAEKQPLDAKADGAEAIPETADTTANNVDITPESDMDTMDNLPNTPEIEPETSEVCGEPTDLTEETHDTDHSDCAAQSEGEPSAASQSQTQQNLDAQQLEDLLSATAEDLPKHMGEHLAEALTGHEATGNYDGLEVAQTGFKRSDALSETVKAHVLQSTTALRTRLHGLLQAKAQQHCIPGRRGKLNPQKLHAIMLNNPKVFLKRGERTQVATAVHLLLDCSGSMQGARITLATQACYAVAVALERCQGVNVGVTVFPAMSTSGNEYRVAPLVRHGDRVHNCFAINSDGGTPLAQALWWVIQRMYPLKEPRKIICILSDGMPDSSQMARSAIGEARRLGFEVMGLGIQDPNMSLLLPKASRTIHTLSDLAPAMFEMLQEALLGHGGRI